MNKKWARQLSENSWEIMIPIMEQGNYGTPYYYLTSLRIWEFTPDEYVVLETAIFVVIVAKYQQKFSCILTGYSMLIELEGGKWFTIPFKDYKLEGNILSYCGNDPQDNPINP